LNNRQNAKEVLLLQLNASYSKFAKNKSLLVALFFNKAPFINKTG
jgi:hypothetical protein